MHIHIHMYVCIYVHTYMYIHTYTHLSLHRARMKHVNYLKTRSNPHQICINYCYKILSWTQLHRNPSNNDISQWIDNEMLLRHWVIGGDCTFQFQDVRRFYMADDFLDLLSADIRRRCLWHCCCYGMVVWAERIHRWLSVGVGDACQPKCFSRCEQRSMCWHAVHAIK